MGSLIKRKDYEEDEIPYADNTDPYLFHKLHLGMLVRVIAKGKGSSILGPKTIEGKIANIVTEEITFSLFNLGKYYRIEFESGESVSLSNILGLELPASLPEVFPDTDTSELNWGKLDFSYRLPGGSPNNPQYARLVTKSKLTSLKEANYSLIWGDEVLHACSNELIDDYKQCLKYKKFVLIPKGEGMYEVIHSDQIRQTIQENIKLLSGGIEGYQLPAPIDLDLTIEEVDPIIKYIHSLVEHDQIDMGYEFNDIGLHITCNENDHEWRSHIAQEIIKMQDEGLINNNLLMYINPSFSEIIVSYHSLDVPEDYLIMVRQNR
jgi:hypothetical protein